MHRRQSWRVGGSRPHRFWAGGRGKSQGRKGRRGSWTGRKILLYLIMYRKYFQKWWLLKRNRIICPEIAEIANFCLENRYFLEICHEKSEFCIKLPEKNRNISQICPEKLIFLWNCLKQNRNFSEIFLKNWNFLWNCLKKEIQMCPEKSIFCYIAWKTQNFSEI